MQFTDYYEGEGEAYHQAACRRGCVASGSAIARKIPLPEDGITEGIFAVQQHAAESRTFIGSPI